MAQLIEDYFGGLDERIDSDRIAGMNSTFQFIFTGDESAEWFIKIADGSPEVTKGKAAEADVELTMEGDLLGDLISGKANPQTAFLSGKIKLKGDMTLAMKLQSVLGLMKAPL